MRVATDFDGPHGSVATETVNSVQLLRWDLKHHQNVSLRQHEFRAWVVWPLMWRTISMFMFITSARSAQCCNGLWRIYSKTVIKEGLKRTTSWGWKVLCKDIWINLGIDTDSRHNCLWFLVWCDWGPLSWSMRCSPLKKTFVWLTKTYPKEEKFNKLNWLPQSYCEQRPNCSANPNPQKSCPTGKKMRLSRKKRILVTGSGWHVRSKRDGGKKEEIVAGSGIWKPYYIPS